MSPLPTDPDFEPLELSTENPPKGVLGTITGTFFKFGATAGRYYAGEDLWPCVGRNLRIQSNLNAGTCFGTIGHGDIDSEDLLGHAAIRTKAIWLDKSTGKLRGRGSAEILDTVQGRTVLALLETETPVTIGIKALGTLLPEKRDGVPIISPDDLTLIRFDIMI